MCKGTDARHDPSHVSEYERRLKAGLSPSPLVKRVQLEEVAGQENVSRTTIIENLDITSTSIVRGKVLNFITTSKRLLWQAYGQEHIEPELLDFIDQIPSDDVYFDIGASNGVSPYMPLRKL